MQPAAIARRKNKSAIPTIIDILKNYQLSILGVTEYILSNPAGNEIIIDAITEELAPLLRCFSKQRALQKTLIEFCHNYAIKVYQSEMEALIAKKDTYCFPLNKATSSQILSFSADGMANDMAETASHIWDLLGHLLDANKRQSQCRNLLRKKQKEQHNFRRMSFESEEMDESDTTSTSESDDSVELDPDSSFVNTRNTDISNKEISLLARYDALTRVVCISNCL